MSTVKIDVKDWPLYVMRLGERARKAAQRGILAGANRCIGIMQRRTEEAEPASDHGQVGAINTGDYRRRWRVAAIENGARLYNEAVQAGVIERGRRPGSRMPNLRAIERWALRRLGLSAAEAKRAAFPMARAIAKRGLRARYVMTGGLREMTQTVAREVNRELDAELARP